MEHPMRKFFYIIYFKLIVYDIFLTKELSFL